MITYFLAEIVYLKTPLVQSLWYLECSPSQTIIQVKYSFCICDLIFVKQKNQLNIVESCTMYKTNAAYF